MSLSEFSLSGKKALVIGARRNMGKGFALGLAGGDVTKAPLFKEGEAEASSCGRGGEKDLLLGFSEGLE